MIIETERPKTINVNYRLFKQLSILRFSLNYKNFNDLIADMLKTSKFSKRCSKCNFENTINNKFCTKCGYLIK